MIKLPLRESMKNVSRIFSAMVCSASLFAFDAHGAVATTSGSNLTAYNPSTTSNNQWASMTNGRYDSTASAKADFGNCNAIVLRCAQPKCANGGCGEMNVAAGIVAGCVKSNDKCKQYGDDLINYMTAELVASSQAKINASNAEQIQAAQNAAQQAQAAAQQAAAQSAQQMAEMQSNMQQQMQQMQQQMAEQNAQSAQAIADALAASQKQQQQAISEMKSAATTAAQVQASGNVITVQDEKAIERGVSEDVLMRNKVSGQITTEIEDAKTSLKEVKVALDKAFIEYAGCDSRGDNCSGPKRVKKWRELALEFIEPYDNVVAKISDALDVAQVVGVDLSDIYMMLNNSCNSWGQYLCPVGQIVYKTDSKGQKGAPQMCSAGGACANWCGKDENGNPKTDCIEKCKSQFGDTTCQPCTLLKLFSSKDTEDIYQSWINTEVTSTENQLVVACASGAVNNNNLLARHARRKSGTGVLDVDILEEWINSHEPSSIKKNDRKCSNDIEKKTKCYCTNATDDPKFTKALNSKTIKADDLCYDYDKTDGYCGSIKPEYAICDVHAWNADLNAPLSKSEEKDKVKEVVGAKVTLIAQQAYKQYEYLAATLRRLETSLKKSVLAAQLEQAGASSNNSGVGSGLSGNNDKTIYLAGAENCSNKSSYENAYSCMQNNISLIITSANTNVKQSCKQLDQTVQSAKIWGVIVDKPAQSTNQSTTPAAKNVIPDKCINIGSSCNKANIVQCAQELNVKVLMSIRDNQQQNQKYKVITME